MLQGRGAVSSQVCISIVAGAPIGAGTTFDDNPFDFLLAHQVSEDGATVIHLAARPHRSSTAAMNFRLNVVGSRQYPEWMHKMGTAAFGASASIAAPALHAGQNRSVLARTLHQQ